MDAYHAKKAANSESIRGYARFLDGLARLEEIDGEAWYRGNRDEAYPLLEEAAEIFNQAREKFLYAKEQCEYFKEWLPEEHREQVTPDLETLQEMAYLLEEIVDVLRTREVPSLQQIHRADGLMRTEMIVAERKALEFRGTPGHFPVGSL